MSEGYLLSPYNELGCFLIDVVELSRYILDTWQDAKVVRLDSSTNYLLHWHYQTPLYHAICGLQGNKQTVSIDGTGGTHLSTADIAIWYRKFVPSECELFLYSASRWENPLKLTDETRIGDVIIWLESS